MTKSTEHDSLVGIESVIERLDAAEASLDAALGRLNRLADHRKVRVRAASPPRAPGEGVMTIKAKSSVTVAEQCHEPGDRVLQTIDVEQGSKERSLRKLWRGFIDDDADVDGYEVFQERREGEWVYFEPTVQERLAFVADKM
jgi:hypothetical protein